MATAIPKAYLASSAIRCRDVETGPNRGVLAVFPSTGATCRSRIRHQAAAGSWTMPRQWEIQRTWLNSARAAVRSPAKPNGV